MSNPFRYLLYRLASACEDTARVRRAQVIRSMSHRMWCKLLGISFLLASACVGQTVYLRTPGTGFCTISNASNATPIVVTYRESHTQCGIANGDSIIIRDVKGNYAANSHVEIAGETKHLIRKIKNINTGAKTFEITDATDTNVAGSGTFACGNYSQCGQFGKVTAYTVKASHNVVLDGPAGTLTTALSDTSGTGRANVANPAYVALKALADDYITGTWSKNWAWNRPGVGGFGEHGAGLAATALMCQINGGTGSYCTRVDLDLDYPEQIYGGSLPCRPNLAFCGTSATTIGDYASQVAGESFALAASIRWPSLSAGVKTKWADFMFRDKPWTSGGIDYTASSWTVPDFHFGFSGDTPVTNHGTVSITAGTTALTCSGGGCAFLTDITPGDTIIIPHPQSSAGGTPFVVASVTNNTTATLDGPAAFTFTNQDYATGPAWNSSTDIGMEFYQKMYSDFRTDISGNAAAYHPTGSYGHSPTNNHFMDYHSPRFARALQPCQAGDQRACLAASSSYMFLYDMAMPAQLSANANGMNGSEIDPYNTWKVAASWQWFAATAKNGITSGPDLCAGNHLCDGPVDSYLQSRTSLDATMPWLSQPADLSTLQNLRTVFMGALIGGPTSTEAKNLAWFKTIRDASATPMNSSFFGSNKGTYAYWAYLGLDPSVSAVAPPLGIVAKTSDVAACTAIFGASLFYAYPDENTNEACDSAHAKLWMSSRTGWASTDTTVHADFSSHSRHDHTGQTGYGGPIYVTRGGKKLLFGDGNGYGNAKVQNSTADVADAVEAAAGADPRAATMPWGFVGTDTVFARGLFEMPAAAGLSAPYERQVFRIGTVVFDHHYSLGTSQQRLARYHLHLNGNGTPASNSVASVSRSGRTFVNAQTGAALVGSVHALGGLTVALTTENSSDTDLSYTGQSGSTGRFLVGSSGDGSTISSQSSAEWVAVMETTSGSTTPSTRVISTVSNHRIVEVQSASPVVLAFTRAGATSTSLSYTTTHSSTARTVVAGLDPGTYAVAVGGTPVSGCAALVVVAGDHTLECSAVASGSITVTAANSGPGTIRGTMRGKF